MVEMAFEVLSKSIWQSITQKQEKNHWKITQAKKTHSHNSDTLKSSFVCNLWNWAKVYLGEKSFSLIGCLEWIAST